MLLASGSFGSGVITITVACVGAGILTFPTAFINAGVGLCLIFLTVVGILTVFSIRFLATGVEFLGLGSFEEMARELLGGHWETFVCAQLFLLNYGAMTAFVTVLKEMLVSIQPQLFPRGSALGDLSLASTFCPQHHQTHDGSGKQGGSRGVSSSATSWESGTSTTSSSDCFAELITLSNPTFLLICMWALFMFPLSLYRSVDSLRFATTLSIGASAFITCCIIIRFFYPEEGDAMAQHGHLVFMEPHVTGPGEGVPPPTVEEHNKKTDGGEKEGKVGAASSRGLAISSTAPSSQEESSSLPHQQRRKAALPKEVRSHQPMTKERQLTAQKVQEKTGGPMSTDVAPEGQEDEEGPVYGGHSIHDIDADDRGSTMDGDTSVDPNGDDTSVNDPGPLPPTHDVRALTDEPQWREFNVQQRSVERDRIRKTSGPSPKKKNKSVSVRVGEEDEATTKGSKPNKEVPIAAVVHFSRRTTPPQTPRSSSNHHDHLYTNNDVSSNGLKWFHFDFYTLLSIPIMIYSLDCQGLVFQVYNSVRNPSTAKLTRMSAVATLVACSFYVLFGWFGAMSFGTHTMSNILSNYHPGPHDALLVVGYAMYSIPVMMNFILVLFISRDAVLNFVYDVNAGEHDTFEHKSAIVPPPSERNGGDGEDDDSASSVSSENSTIAAHKEHLVKTSHFAFWSILMSSSSLVIAIYVPGVVVLMGFLGSMFSTTIGFTIPAAYRIQMARMGLVPWGASVCTHEEFLGKSSTSLFPSITEMESMRSPSERMSLQGGCGSVAEEGGRVNYGATAQQMSSSSPGAIVAESPADDAAPLGASHHRHYHRRLNKVITVNIFVGTMEMLSAYFMFIGGIFAAVIGTYISFVQMQEGEK